MKTIQPNSASKANMQATGKSGKKTLTPSNDGQKNNKDSSTGKKLKQARLPFKVISATPPIKPLEEPGAASSETTEVQPKKRKLSFTEEPENQKKIAVDVIVLDDEESGSEHLPTVSNSPKTPVASSDGKVQKNKNKSAQSNNSGDGKVRMRKLQIKLPLSGGKKKRKSRSASKSLVKNDSDVSDVELVSEEELNPEKKLKLLELPPQDVQDSIVKEAFSSTEGVSKTEGDDTKNSSRVQNSPTESKDNQQCDIELQTPKSSKREEKIKVAKRSDEMKLAKTENSEETKNTEVARISGTKTSSDDFEEKSQQASKDNLDSSSKEQLSREKIPSAQSSRRSLRVSEIEKNKKDAEEELSSEPEIVSEPTNSAETSVNKGHPKATKLLTPKQQKLMEQRKRAREEKELKLQQQKEERERKLQEQREERERKQQEEKMQKQKEREERETLRKKEREEKEEQKRREKEEKEDQRRKEKEDKERKRLAEIEAKNEEKRKKDEAKEEERRKKDEDRRRKELEKEEEENKKKKAAEAFTKFFVAKPTKLATEEEQESRDGAESVDSLAFRPFQVKGDMKLAPLVRREFNEISREKLDSFLQNSQAGKSAALYLGELKSGAHTPLKGYKTVLKNNYEDDEEDDVIVIATELENAAQPIDEPRSIPVETYRAKYYLFRENRRPPFYGTWRKKSTVITPRRPFATDKAFFDYEVDSDEEWEEEEPGESLNGSEDEKENESEDEDYEVDNEWFVPHGHLSDEELQNEDELGPDTSREAQKAKLKVLQQEFAQEMKKKTEKIKPRLIGTIWVDENGNRPKLCPSIIWDSLCTRAMVFCEPPMIEAPATECEPSTPPPEKQQRIKIKDELMKDLVRLVHGNRHSRVFLIKEYTEHVCNVCEAIKNGEYLAPTKSQIREKIDEIAEWSHVDVVNKKNKNRKKLCWVVSADILDKYGLGNLSLRNEWAYKLQPKFDKELNDPETDKTTEDGAPKQGPAEAVTTEKKKRKTDGITKFTKVISKDDKLSQPSGSKSASPKATARNSPKALNDPSSSTNDEVPPTFKKPAAPVPVPIPAKTNKNAVVKKRVPLLMSVPPGQQFSPQSKNALISKFLQKNKTAPVAKSIESDPPSKVPTDTKMDVDEVLVLD